MLATTQGARELNVTVVYEDADSSRWARETCEHMFVGPDRRPVHSTWWKLDELGEPAVLAGAVSKAMRADAIVVAIRSTEGLPLPFYVWVRSWLPHRLQGEGQFVALITSTPGPGFQRNRATEYLGAVAQQARMRFQFIERKAACEAPLVSEERSRRLWRNAVRALNTPAPRLHRPARRGWRIAG